MKTIKITGLFLFFSFVLFTDSIYNYSVPKIQGGNQPMSVYQGKKILITTLPVQQNASADSLLEALDTLASAHSSNLIVIAVPSYEDGYTAALKNQLQQWYQSKLGAYIVLTDGVYTRKISGAQQHPLFKWLTDVTLNEDFDIDVTGPGYKFFVSGSGLLYSVLRPVSKISGPSVQKTLQIQ